MNSEKESLDWIFNRNSDKNAILRKLGDGIKTKIFVGKDSMLSFVRLEPNCIGTTHKHPEEQWGVLLEGTCTRIYRGKEIKMEEGDFWYTAPDELHGIRAGNKGALILDIFSPPRPDYQKGGSGFANID